MLKYEDICVIIGKEKSGKTLLSRTLAKSLTPNYNYIDYNFVDSKFLHEFYNQNKDTKRVIILDNYERSYGNKRIDSLYRKNHNFTLIYVMSSIDTYVADGSDIIYVGKETNYSQIKNYHSKLKCYYKDFYLDWLVNAMEDLEDYGFVSLDKDKRYTDKEIYLKI